MANSDVKTFNLKNMTKRDLADAINVSIDHPKLAKVWETVEMLKKATPDDAEVHIENDIRFGGFGFTSKEDKKRDVAEEVEKVFGSILNDGEKKSLNDLAGKLAEGLKKRFTSEMESCQKRSKSFRLLYELGKELSRTGEMGAELTAACMGSSSDEELEGASHAALHLLLERMRIAAERAMSQMECMQDEDEPGVDCTKH